jgi:aminobenzoyl-glutamate utilization protein B
MKRSLLMFALAAVTLSALPATTARGEKAALYRSIESRSDKSWEMASKIWQWAEPGYQEKRSAKLLADTLEAAGFSVQRGVAGIPTAFTATAGSGKPVIAILGEFDALPGVSQQAVPQRRARDGVTYGHACGHHLFGVASASASIALAEQIRLGEISGTIRFYGCPAEEGGSAKAFMVREGLFDDCDIALHWHPSSRNVVGDRSCLARIAVKFRFHGKSAHAAGAPEQGRSALDAVELTNHAAQLLREHTPDLTRIHHVVTAGGDAPNVVPNFCEVFYYIRHPRAEIVRELYPRLVKCAEAGALATETKLEVAYLGGTMQLLPNNSLGEVTKVNMNQLSGLEYDDQQREFAIRIHNTLEQPEPLESIGTIEDLSGQIGKGSTDVGDVSWVTPTTGFTTACWVPGTPGHSWQAVAAGGTSIGRQGMQMAAKVLAASAWDLFENPALVAAAKQEHRERLSGRKYDPMLEPNQPPPLDYRDPPNRASPQ